ncbi:DUF7002 family protein [Isoptericola sp. NPDC057559]|uniref:DUF7002 family protein n=1 Tax=Isoptericola sp. NPDC057559 TaxID=3346168 RepID=UPI0036B1D834
MRKYPRLFHTAADGAWPSIRDYGLYSTKALVRAYDPPVETQAAILGAIRRTSFTLTRPGRDDVVIRDQGPLKFLSVCLEPGVSELEYLEALNSRVFFHVNEHDLHRLLGARRYRSHAQTVLTVDTATFLAAHRDVELAPYNTGSVHVPNMPARSPALFVRLEDYPWEDWRSRRGAKAAVRELTVTSWSDVAPAVVAAERWLGGEPIEVLYNRDW